ncbi:MAG: helix-turn-helix domain-containing protein, partial [Promethearchaeia archaeon]
MQLSQKIRIYPTEEQLQVLWDLSEKCRLIYNFALSDRINTWKNQKKKPKQERKYITYTQQQNRLPKIKDNYPEYKWVYSKVLQMTLRKLDANYRSFFSLWKSGDN